ncbi:hypothetical protein B0H12DRAFT_377944 [Mycena haematopus]|nr:hypothetical protein B0H12DRAFT_377944 [Mycena haematopus]
MGFRGNGSLMRVLLVELAYWHTDDSIVREFGGMHGTVPLHGGVRAAAVPVPRATTPASPPPRLVGETLSASSDSAAENDSPNDDLPEARTFTPPTATLLSRRVTSSPRHCVPHVRGRRVACREHGERYGHRGCGVWSRAVDGRGNLTITRRGFLGRRGWRDAGMRSTRSRRTCFFQRT